MSCIESLKKSFTDFITEFENLKIENKKLKQLLNKNEVKFAKFYNLTFLYPGRFPGFIEQSEEEEYHLAIRSHITENKYNDGDIIFIGSTYETRQYYGFANIEGNDFITGEFPSTGGYKDVYYRDAIDDINEFWVDLEGSEYFTIDDIKDVKENGSYEP